MRTALAAALVASSSIASAQPGITDPTAPDPDYRSPAHASLLSAIGTASGLTAMWVGAKGHNTPFVAFGGILTMFGPSFGEWWARDTPYFTPGFGIRLVGLSIMAVGYGSALDRACSTQNCAAPIRDRNSDTVIGFGAAIGVVGILWDVATASREAHAANVRRISIAPTWVQAPNGAAPGLGIAGSF